MRPEPRYQPGDHIGGRYQVHKVLIGGMGEVYLCWNLQEMHPYALKTFQQRYLTNLQRLHSALETEVATWVALETHPSIVRCFGMRTLDNQPFIVLEWIAGEDGRGTDLRGWLQRGPLDLKLALEIVIDICGGLMHAQQKQPGLVHRDLKPENILMAQGGLAKITDFGLVQIVATSGLEVAQESTTTNSYQCFVSSKSIAGTPAYMAPEQWRGQQLDERTDIYALGIILYEMLTGTLPYKVDFTPGNPHHWLQAMQAAHEFASYPKLPAALAADFTQLIHCCLAKTQDMRPTSLVDLSNQLTGLYQQQIGKPPPTRPTSANFNAAHYNNRGLTYADLHEYERALTDYERAIALDPNFAQVYSNRGGVYAALQEYELALADFGQAIALDPTFAQVYYNRAVTYSNLQKYERALTDFERAIELDPNDAKAHANRGGTYVDLQEYEHALTDYGQAIALDPDYANAYMGRGITYGTLQEYGQALADLGHAIELDLHNAKAYYNRGVIYSALQEYERALADYGRAIKLDPNYIQAYHNRGVTYEALQEYERALGDYRRALELDPDFAHAHLNIGALLGNQGRLEEALAYFERAAQLNEPKGSQYATQVRQMLGWPPTPQMKLTEQALTTFAETQTLEAMRQAVIRFPVLEQADFIATIEQSIVQQAPSEQRPVFEQRLAWLRQIVKEQSK